MFDLLLLATAEKSQGSCAFGDYVRDAYSKLSLIIPAPAAGEVIKRRTSLPSQGQGGEALPTSQIITLDTKCLYLLRLLSKDVQRHNLRPIVHSPNDMTADDSPPSS